MMTDSTHFDASRRDFMKFVSLAGAGLTLGIYLPAVSAQSSGPGKTSSGDKIEAPFEPNAFVRINADNTVNVIIKHLEMGQGTFTGLATLVAEELDADWAQIKPEAAPADASRYNNLQWGPSQGTGGSTAMANSFQQMRSAGAAAKMMLIAAAAEKWKLPEAEIKVSRGIVSHGGSGRSATFGELAVAAGKQPVPDAEEINLKAPKDFVYIGKYVPRKDQGKADGSAIFTQDIKMEGMLTALVAHSPRFGGKVRSFDARKAKAVKGVVDVVQIPSGIAVLATGFWGAKTGRDALEIDWDESTAFRRSSSEIMAQYRELAKKPGLPARKDGDTGIGMSKAVKVLEASYEFPYLAHAAMEPMNCVALVSEEGCEIWNGVQVQTLDQTAVATALGIQPEQVKINMLFAGGSFGRRANPQSDYTLEAVHIAREKMGTPVKLMWTREDDMRAGYYRPLYLHTLKAGLDKEGNPIAWEQRIVGQSILKGTAFESFLVKDGVDSTSVEGAATLPYKIPNLSVELHTTEQAVPVQWWRSVGSTHTAYSTETFMDELARAAGKDPVEFRMQLLADHPRHQGVLRLAAEKAGWGSVLPAGWGRGVAVHESFNSYVAEVAEISLQEGGGFKVERVVCAVDCGIAVNPDIIKAQMEGGIGFGLSPTLLSEITLQDGKVEQSNFNDYQVIHLEQMPEIEVHIVPSAEPPTGVGEPGTPPIAPAVANALSAATGRRYYSLPLKVS